MKYKITGAAILFAAAFCSIQASADPVLLVCSGYQATWTLEIDAAAGRAGGMSATFTAQDVKWRNMSSGTDYYLDRVSGALQINGEGGFTCRPPKK